MAINAIPEMCHILTKICIQKHNKQKNYKMLKFQSQIRFKKFSRGSKSALICYVFFSRAPTTKRTPGRG